MLRNLFWSAGALTLPSLTACGGGGGGDTITIPPPPQPNGRFAAIGPLQAPDANGLSLPRGFSSRVVAVSGEAAGPGKGYVWHASPDGGCTFATPDGGWIYVSNCELPPRGGINAGGVGALRFDSAGNVVDAYPILTGTRVNCAGGKTPWGTWLSCEETSDGLVYECDPFTAVPTPTGGNGVARPLLGVFSHEAAAVDPTNRILYFTEDAGSGSRFYRFVPSAADWPAGAARPALAEGKLQVLRYTELARDTKPPSSFNVEQSRAVIWEDVVNPSQPQTTVRASLGSNAPGTPFPGAEGLWWLGGIAYFSNKVDNRIWAYDHAAQSLICIYDFNTATGTNKIITGVDNLTVAEGGDVLVAEDGGDMQLCVITPNRFVLPLLQASDFSPSTNPSEITGPAFSPDGTRLYFSAQRNGRNGAMGSGITFEVTLPFSACPTRAC